MKRRGFIGLLGSAVAASSGLAGHAQSRKVWRIGVLNPGAGDVPGAAAFYSGMRDLGYEEGVNVVFERRYGNPDGSSYQMLSDDLVRQKVDVIVVISTSPARAAKQSTSTIPILVGGMADPIGDGLVASLARPGGNLTGTSFIGPELIAKRLGLFKEALPSLRRVSALVHVTAYGPRTMDAMLAETRSAAEHLDLRLSLAPVTLPSDIGPAFDQMIRDKADAMIQLPSPMLYGEHRAIVGLAARTRLPAMYAAREFVDDGGLMSYGASLPSLFRSVATYVDKIVRGAKPGELPVQQPESLELAINLKTAKDLGLAFPASLVSLADVLVE